MITPPSAYHDRSLPAETSTDKEEITEDGVLNPLTIEETGYASPGVLSGRTDTGTDTSYEIFLDEEHGWVASRAEVDVWNLTRLYAVNGSFVDGIPGPNVNPNGSVEYHPYGWDATSYEPETYNQTQLAAYDDSSTGYVVVENKGEKKGPSNHQIHAAGTYVLWNQTLRNLDGADDAFLSFRHST